MIIIYSPSIWHLYLSLIFICGLSKMNISSLKLWMYCSTAGISDLKTFVQFLHLICFLVSPETVRELLLACWRAVPGCSGLQGIYGEALEPQSPWTPPLSPLLSPFSSCGPCLSSPTFVSPFVVGFSPSVFLAVLSGFYAPFSFFSSSQRAGCFSLAVAIEITALLSASAKGTAVPV